MGPNCRGNQISGWNSFPPLTKSTEHVVSNNKQRSLRITFPKLLRYSKKDAYVLLDTVIVVWTDLYMTYCFGVPAASIASVFTELEHAMGDREEWKMATRRVCTEDQRRQTPI